jgi:uncharacterized protein (TIGR02996 family)
MDLLLIDPGPAKLTRALESARVEANGRRTRHAVGPDQVAAWPRRIRKSPHGHVEENGGSYGSSQWRVFTAAIAVAWYTDAVGDKHVRIRFGNVRCRNHSHIPTLLPGTRGQQKVVPPVLLVHDRLLDVVWNRRKCQESDVEHLLIKTILRDPDDIVAWGAFSDWLEENGREEDAGSLRFAFHYQVAGCA